MTVLALSQYVSFHARGSEVGETWQAGYFNDREREFHHTFDKHIEALLVARKGTLRQIYEQPDAVAETIGDRVRHEDALRVGCDLRRGRQGRDHRLRPARARGRTR